VNPTADASPLRAAHLRRAAAIALGVAWLSASIGVRLLDPVTPWAAHALQTGRLVAHAGVHAALAVWFGSTLLRGAMPLITRLALRVHGSLTPAKEHYTRRVTRLWTGTFAVIAVVSPALFVALPFDDWVLFADVASPLLLIGLFFGEYALRYRLHPEFERTRVRDMVRAWRHTARAGGPPAAPR
jgi:uncharacterized membrane protein